jgi:hypothetical protein
MQNEVYVNALTRYFKLKADYESIKNKGKNKIMKMPDLSWKEKRKEYSKFRPRCVNCKRPVGSQFYTAVSEDSEDRQLVARCGDRKHPCDLSIKIMLGHTFYLVEDLALEEKKMLEKKREIICSKNDLLFGYVTAKEAVETFDDMKTSYSTLSKNYETFLDLYTKATNSSEKKEELTTLEMETFALIEEMKALLEEYKKRQDVRLVKDAVTIYVTALTPKLDVLMKAKYADCYVNYDDQNNVYSLVQHRASASELEVVVGEEIVSFVEGKGTNKGTRKRGAKKTASRKDSLSESEASSEDADSDSDSDSDASSDSD